MDRLEPDRIRKTADGSDCRQAEAGAGQFGFAGGESQMIVKDDGKRMIKRISDMSFVR